ncbi:hypothetical protein EBI01_07490 [Marinomonas rhizomae]|uniref:HNH endonuclease n=1 Tax=Marinomonas rhizomae TaxID=491948 RepID=A0A366JB02_9GAMM|nr:AAA family ATPase [Marinomonas rhizomae]RBP83570.1 HNH endonuclease [Marinomonas rhizomae]RNF74114.1 hypothetical protein EBI01_07490 [Marinomonas rhizomae]
MPQILDNLGFYSSLKIAFKPKYTSFLIKLCLLKSKNLPYEEYSNKLSKLINDNSDIRTTIDYDKIENILKINVSNLSVLLSALMRVEDPIRTSGIFHLDLLKEKNNDFIKDITLLLEYDFIRIVDVRLNKKNHGEISIRRASSGEQCMMVIMLGIAGNIKNNSLIFIDEPEISLHPKWQEDFMPMLIKAFSIYSGCQFFIATHSPQIVSGMKGENCFVTDLASRKLYPASFFSGKSADFQLAEIFGSPGQMNEYLSRLCFNLIFKLRNKKEITKNDYDNLDSLEKSKKQINANDPIIALIETVEEVFKMPLINTPITFDEDDISLISEIKDREAFDSNSWGIDELIPLRSKVRAYYRDIQNGTCPYCKERIATRSAGNAQIEHIIPKSEHIIFMFEPKNLCVSCGDCNEYKSRNSVTKNDFIVCNNHNPQRYPTSQNTFKIVHPHFDIYEEHLIKEGLFYRDLTPKGHFTIGICKLNQRSANYGREPEALDDSSLHDIFNIFEANADDAQKEMLKNMLLGAINA